MNPDRTKKIYHSKIAPPRLHRTIPRERLFTQLDRLSATPITWISSPAGSGKTTLIASFLEARDIPALWYRVDESDADVATLFYYMAEAVRSLRKGKSKNLPPFTSEYRRGISIFARNYFEHLFSKLKTPSAIVFDNYQNVSESSEFHEIIKNGLRMVPEGIRVFILSREAFPPPFVALQAEDRLATIDWDDLRLSIDEVKMLMAKRSNMDISDSLTRRIHEKTQGWAAAVVLIMARGKIPESDIESVGQSSVLNYFTVEIFDKFDAKTQRLLLGTALLPTVSPQSGRELANVEDSSQVLTNLDHNHFFVSRYGAEYHYHPLFREFLLLKLEGSLSPEEMRRAQHNAGMYLLKTGKIEEAIHLMTSATDWNTLIPTILNNAYDFVMKGMDKTVEQWIQRIPEEILSQIPWLIYWLGFCKHHYDAPAGYALFVRSFEMFENTEDMTGALSAWEGAVHSILFQGWNMKQYDRWINWMDAYSAKNGPYPSSEIEANVASGMVGALLARHPDRSDLCKWLEKAHFLAKPLSAFAYMFLGDYQRWSIVTQELKNPIGSGDLFFNLCWYYNRASFMNETAPLEQLSLDNIEEGIELSQRNGMLYWIPYLFAEGFYTAIRMLEFKRALGYLKKMEFTLEYPPNILHVRYHSACALYDVLTGNLAGAITHIQQAQKMASETGFIPIEALIHVDSAFVMIETGDLAEAKNHISACRALPFKSSSIVEFGTLIAEAMLALRQNKPDVSCIVRKAMALGKREGYIAPYSWWQPSVMSTICSLALAENTDSEYAKTIIRALHLRPVDIRIEELDKWPWPCSIRTFGGFQLTIYDKPFVAQGSKRPLDLLKALIAFGGDEVRQETIEDELWPEADGDVAHIAFKTNLSRLRKIIGDQTIQVRDGKVSLNPEHVWLDLWAFESLAERVSELHRKQTVSLDQLGKVEHLVFEIYRGDFFAMDDYVWLERVQDSLRKRLSRVLERMTDIFNKSGQTHKSKRIYERAAELGLL